MDSDFCGRSSDWFPADSARHCLLSVLTSRAFPVELIVHASVFFACRDYVVGYGQHFMYKGDYGLVLAMSGRHSLVERLEA